MNQANFIQVVNQYVCDTHTLVWFLTNDDRLGHNVKEILEQAQDKHSGIDILLPIVVLMEMMSIVEKKKIKVPLAEILEFIEFSDSFKICSIDVDVFKEMLQISKKLELHDRAIVAVAQLNNAIILTIDREIKKVYKEIIW